MNDPNKAAIAVGTTVAVAAALFKAPLWGSLLLGVGGILVTKAAIAATA